MPSDPFKVAKMRVMNRAWDAYIAGGGVRDAVYMNATRLALKAGEAPSVLFFFFFILLLLLLHTITCCLAVCGMWCGVVWCVMGLQASTRGAAM